MKGTDSKMKHGILMITEAFSPNVDGLATHLDGVCKYLGERGHKVFVVTYQPLTTRAKGPKVEKQGNVEIRRIQWFGHNWRHRLERYPALFLLYVGSGLFVSSFFFLLKRRKEIDVIDAQGLATGFVAKVLAKIFKKRSVVSLHAIFGFKRGSLLSRMAKWTLASFDVILPFAQKTKDELIAIGLLETKMELYVSCVDLDLFRPLNQDRCKQELGLEGKFVGLFLGRLLEKKGVNVVLEAARLVDPIITLAFVGDGPLADKIKAEAKNQKNIVFFGRVPNFETPKYYNAADVFIIPSQYEEQFGVVVLEALACGTPVIAANKGGIPEVMDSSVGVFIEPSAEHIASMVNFFCEHPAELAKLRANCRPYAQARFSPNNMDLIERAYDVG